MQSFLKSTKFTLFALAVIVFLVRLFLTVFFSPEDPTHALHHDRWGTIAANIAEGYGYVYPYHSDPSGETPTPDAERGPVPVLWFAALFVIFGRSLWVVMIGNWLLDVGTAICLFKLTKYTFPEKRGVAVLTVLMFAFYVPGILNTYEAMSEPILTLLLMLHLLTLVHLLDQPSLGRAAMGGLWLGLAVLARPIMLVFPAVVFGLVLLRYRSRWQTVKHFGVLVLILAVVLIPWVVRNYLTFGAFVPSSNAFGYSLLQDNYYLNTADYPRALRAQDVRAEMERLLSTRGDSAVNYDAVRLDKLYAREALARIAQRPDRYLALSACRFLRLWFNLGYFGAPPSARSWLVTGLHTVLLGLVAISFVRERRIRTRQAMPIWATILFFTIVHVPLLAIVRYVFPVMPLVMLLAAPVVQEGLTKSYMFSSDLIRHCVMSRAEPCMNRGGVGNHGIHK